MRARSARRVRSPAAGQLSLLMVGAPGTGKSMLARRLADLLPALSHEEALESAAILSVAGAFSGARWGERVLRAARQADFPAAFQLVVAMNPCPCGQLGSAGRNCRCTPDAVLRYRGRISAPLLDRIDLQTRCPPCLRASSLALPRASRARSSRATWPSRASALDRQGVVNGELAGASLDRHCRLDASASHFLQSATTRLGWSAWSFHRILRVARTIADLEASAVIATPHLAEAIQYRRTLGSAEAGGC